MTSYGEAIRWRAGGFAHSGATAGGLQEGVKRQVCALVARSDGGGLAGRSGQQGAAAHRARGRWLAGRGPGVLSLAGINRVEGFVYDEQAGDCT
jgi:hypothetical protein